MLIKPLFFYIWFNWAVFDRLRINYPNNAVSLNPAMNHGFFSCREAIQIAYGASVVLLNLCPFVPKIMRGWAPGGKAWKVSIWHCRWSLKPKNNISNKQIIPPVQFLPSEIREYPVLQEQLYDPSVLRHLCWQPPLFVLHSSISVVIRK